MRLRRQRRQRRWMVNIGRMRLEVNADTDREAIRAARLEYEVRTGKRSSGAESVLEIP